MEEIQETVSALRQLSNELNRIISIEILETDQMLRNLMEDLVGVEESEILTQSAQTKMVDEEGVTITAESRLKNLEALL